MRSLNHNYRLRIIASHRKAQNGYNLMAYVWHYSKCGLPWHRRQSSPDYHNRTEHGPFGANYRRDNRDQWQHSHANDHCNHELSHAKQRRDAYIQCTVGHYSDHCSKPCQSESNAIQTMHACLEWSVMRDWVHCTKLWWADARQTKDACLPWTDCQGMRDYHPCTKYWNSDSKRCSDAEHHLRIFTMETIANIEDFWNGF